MKEENRKEFLNTVSDLLTTAYNEGFNDRADSIIKCLKEEIKYYPKDSVRTSILTEVILWIESNQDLEKSP